MKPLPNGIFEVEKTKTKSGKLEYTFSVSCVSCGRLRIVRRKQHAVAMSKKPCKKCSNKKNHPIGEVNGVRVSFFNRFEIGAIQRSKEWNLTVEQAAMVLKSQDYKCRLTNLPITATGDFDKITASLDRIDNTKGYSVENIQWTHKVINMMRGILDVATFVEMCKLVASNHPDS